MSLRFFYFCLSTLLAIVCSPVACAEGQAYRFSVTVASPLKYENVPADPGIDFGELLGNATAAGVLDPRSIRVVDLADGRPVPHAIEGFVDSDRGQVAWVIEDFRHSEYEIRFRTANARPTAQPRKFVPLIGNGDLLRYNAGIPRPITLFYAMGMADMTGDGRDDLLGCWNYAYRPGDPWDGIICYPRVRAPALQFGELRRLRHVRRANENELLHFAHTYMAADFEDYNGDGLTDVVQTRKGTDSATIYLNTGRRDADGMPVFELSTSISWWGEGTGGRGLF